MIVGRDGAVPSLRAAPYPVAARRRAVTVLVSPLHIEPAPAALVASSFFSFFCGHTFVWPLALLGRHVFFIVGHLVAVARYTRAHVCKHSCAGAGEPRRRAESWRSAAASSARWIGSRRSPKLRSSAVARAIGLIFCLADALRGFGRRGGPLRTGVLSRSNSRRSLAADVWERQNTNSLRGLP